MAEIPAHWPRIVPCPYCADGTAHHPCPPVDGDAMLALEQKLWRETEADLADARLELFVSQLCDLARKEVWVRVHFGVLEKIQRRLSAPRPDAASESVTEAMRDRIIERAGLDPNACDTDSADPVDHVVAGIRAALAVAPGDARREEAEYRLLDAWQAAGADESWPGLADVARCVENLRAARRGEAS